MKTRRITANLPEELLRTASEVTQGGITETLVQGLKLLKRSKAYDLAQSLRGKLRLKLDLGLSRERPRR